MNLVLTFVIFYTLSKNITTLFSMVKYASFSPLIVLCLCLCNLYTVWICITEIMRLMHIKNRFIFRHCEFFVGIHYVLFEYCIPCLLAADLCRTSNELYPLWFVFLLLILTMSTMLFILPVNEHIVSRLKLNFAVNLVVAITVWTRFWLLQNYFGCLVAILMVTLWPIRLVGKVMPRYPNLLNYFLPIMWCEVTLTMLLQALVFEYNTQPIQLN